VNAYQYDARNRMAAADQHRYGYNALAQRVFKPRFGLPGDITGDGTVTEQDLTLLQRALKGEIPKTMAMDCNRDGVVDNKDTSCIARQIGGHKSQGQGQGQGGGKGKQGSGPAAAASMSASAELAQVGWLLFVYDDAGRLIGEYDELGNAVRQYVWLDDIPLAVIAADGMYFIHSDHLNTPRAVTDTAGDVVWQANLKPFGEEFEPVSDMPFDLLLRFPGQYHDRETGLYQNWHREYASGLGRYAQVDPLGLHAGTNLYSYVIRNPIVETDPTGLYNPERADMSFPRDGPFGGVCGPEGFELATWIPDGKLRNACQRHDDCYAECGSDRYQCDAVFLTESGSRLYYWAVRVGGGSAHERAQEKCQCG
jgi:RHS repeat-associated protein